MTKHPSPQQYQTLTPSTRVYPNTIMNAGLFGAIVGGTASLALNLHKVQEDSMTTKQAFVDSLAKGAGAGVATAAGTAVATSARLGSFASFALLVATATGVGYVLNSVGKSVSENAVSVLKK
ncbi:MAG: magnetosome protein MamC [Deltaproteobacteria bacterium]|nr:magnetosome protein MamC [Deltaproteobacteria bacterium]